MKLHEIYPHNKFLFFIGAILGFIGTFLDNTNKSSFAVTISLLLVGFVLILLSFKKPEQSRSDEL
jgi:uncharacterized membrane protein